MKLKIGYLSQTDEDYVKAIRSCNTLKDLLKATKKYRELAEDAYTVAKKMTENDFIKFQEGLRKESTGAYAGDKWNKKYGAIILPKEILLSGLLACEYNVPFGCAHIRRKEIEKEKAGKV